MCDNNRLHYIIDSLTYEQCKIGDLKLISKINMLSYRLINRLSFSPDFVNFNHLNNR